MQATVLFWEILMFTELPAIIGNIQTGNLFTQMHADVFLLSPRNPT